MSKTGSKTGSKSTTEDESDESFENIIDANSVDHEKSPIEKENIIEANDSAEIGRDLNMSNFEALLKAEEEIIKKICYIHLTGEEINQTNIIDYDNIIDIHRDKDFFLYTAVLDKLTRDLDNKENNEDYIKQYYKKYNLFVKNEEIKPAEKLGKLRKNLKNEELDKKYLDIKYKSTLSTANLSTAKIIFKPEKRKSGWFNLRRRTINKFVGIEGLEYQKTMIKLPMYDKNGSKSKKFSIVVGVDEHGNKFISAPLGIILDGVTDINSLVKIKIGGKEYTMPITYKQYEEYHNEMLSEASKKMNVISDKIKENLSKTPEMLLKEVEKFTKKNEELKLQIETKDKKIEKLTEKNEELEAQAKKKDEKIEELKVQIETKDEKIEEWKEVAKNENNELMAKNEKIGDLEAQVKTKDTEIQKLHKTLKTEKLEHETQLNRKDRDKEKLERQLNTQKLEHERQLNEKNENHQKGLAEKDKKIVELREENEKLRKESKELVLAIGSKDEERATMLNTIEDKKLEEAAITLRQNQQQVESKKQPTSNVGIKKRVIDLYNNKIKKQDANITNR